MRISDWSSDVCSSDLAAALSFYRSRLPSKMTSNMATGYYTFAPADFSVNPAGAKTDLTIKHTDGGLSHVDVDLQSGGSIPKLTLSRRLLLNGINFDYKTVFALYHGDYLTSSNSDGGSTSG